MNKVRILQFPIANSNGGITHYALNNWKWMNKDIFQCDFATMSKRLDFEDEILATGSKIYYISCYAEEDEKQFEKEFREILANGYDIVHLHTKQWKSFIVEELCIEYGVPKIIVHSHNTGIDTLNPQKRDFEIRLHERMKQKFNLSLATDFWACSKLAAEFLFGRQIPQEKIAIMPNAIELDCFAFDQQVRIEYRKKYGLENCFVMGHTGRFAYQKNHSFLIDIFAAVSKIMDSARLVLLGDGGLFPEIKSKVADLGLERKILFLGHRTDINNWYSAMDLFLLPSKFEGLPIAAIEAQASGLSCLVSDRITEEVMINENVSMLPLEVGLWTEKILECHQNNYREENGKINLMKEGYDIAMQIKVIENEYLSGGGGNL